jgi:hypothetical protein
MASKICLISFQFISVDTLISGQKLIGIVDYAASESDPFD